MQMRGGILTHMASFGTGRFGSLGGLQHIDVFLDTAVLASLLWYSCNKKVDKNLVFWGVLAVSLFMQFTWSGSRSSVIFPLAYLLVIRMYHTRSIPWVRTGVVGGIALILFGMLGLIRHSTYRGEGPNLEALTEFRIQESIEYAGERVEERASSVSNLAAIVGRVPRDVDFLYGRTYLGVLFNFVPRAIWEGKPRGTGSYVKEYLYGTTGDVKIVDAEPQGSANPSGATGALYWNFYIPGVVVGWVLFGIFHRWLAHLLQKNPSPLLLPPYIVVVTASPAPTNLTPMIRKFLLILLLMYALGVISFGRRK